MNTDRLARILNVWTYGRTYKSRCDRIEVYKWYRPRDPDVISAVEGTMKLLNMLSIYSDTHSKDEIAEALAVVKDYIRWSTP